MHWVHVLEEEVKTLIETLVKVKAKARVTAHSDTLSEVEAKTLNDILVKVKVELLVDALAVTP